MNYHIIVFAENDFKVGLLHNEVFVDIPGCSTEDKWCDFDKFVSLFSPNVTSCDFSKICETFKTDFDEITSTLSDTSDTIKIEYPTQGEDDRY